MLPGMTSHNTLKGPPVEASIAASVISSGNKLNDFPVMKLAVEIRLEIYSYLLVTYPSRLRRGSYNFVTLEINCTWHEDQWKTTAIGRTSSLENSTSSGLATQILRTCKAINREATPMLYGENVFQFQPGRDSLCVAKEELDALCRKLYPDPAVRWIEGLNSTPSHSTLAIFLRQIGQQNAASLKKLMFLTEKAILSSDGQQAGRSMQVVTQLLKLHVPGLHQVMICRDFRWIRVGNGPWEPRRPFKFDDLYTPKNDTSLINDPRTQSSTHSEIKISVNHADTESWADPVLDAFDSSANEESGEVRTEGSTEYEQHLPGSYVDDDEETTELPATFNSYTKEETIGKRKINSHAKKKTKIKRKVLFSVDLGTTYCGNSRWNWDYGLALHREEQDAMHKAVADMVQEITWLKQLSVVGFDEDDPAFQKWEDLQTLVKTRC